MSLCAGSAHAEHAHNYRKFEYLGEFLKKMEIARDPYFMALLSLIHAKKRRRKSHAWAPLRREETF
jgi:hypothetical protein